MPHLKKVDTFKDICQELEDLLDAGGSGVEADIRFHAAIADMAEHRFLQERVVMLRPHLYMIVRSARPFEYTRYFFGQIQARLEHRAIIDAIANKQPDQARQAMINHIDSSKRRVFKGTGE